jgi:hypothetical protein
MDTTVYYTYSVNMALPFIFILPLALLVFFNLITFATIVTLWQKFN